MSQQHLQYIKMQKALFLQEILSGWREAARPVWQWPILIFAGCHARFHRGLFKPYLSTITKHHQPHKLFLSCACRWSRSYWSTPCLLWSFYNFFIIFFCASLGCWAWWNTWSFLWLLFPRPLGPNNLFCCTHQETEKKIVNIVFVFVLEKYHSLYYIHWVLS